MNTTHGLRATFAALCAFVSVILVLGPSRVGAIETVTPWTLISASDDAEIYVLMGGLPRENAANPALQSSTWGPAMTNWRENILLGGMESAGTGFSQVRRLSAIDYNLMVTSSAFESWHALVDTDGSSTQFGGRIHVAVAVIGKRANWSFLPRDMTVVMKSYAWNTSGTAVVTDTVVNSTATFGTLNEYRLRLDSAGSPGIVGDVRSSDQSSGTPTTRFLYVGSGFAAAAFGTGTPQEMLDRARNYGVAKNLMVEVAVTVPGTDGESARTATGKTVLLNQMLQQPEVWGAEGLGLPFGYVTPERTTIGATAEGQTTDPARVYLMQRSTELSGWTGANTVALIGNSSQLLFPTPFMPNTPRGFARIVTTAPQTLLLAQGQQQVPRGTPVATEVPLGDNVTP